MKTKIDQRWKTQGGFLTMEGATRTIWIDKTEKHPYRGVYLAPVGAPIDVFGNPSSLRDAPIGVYRQVGRLGTAS